MFKFNSELQICIAKNKQTFKLKEDITSQIDLLAQNKEYKLWICMILECCGKVELLLKNLK